MHFLFTVRSSVASKKTCLSSGLKTLTLNLNSQGNGTNGIWGCGKDSDDGLVKWEASACGPLTSVLTDANNQARAAWKTRPGGQEKINVVKDAGNGGLMCCRSTVSLPVGVLNGGVKCDHWTEGTAYVMHTLPKAQDRFADAQNVSTDAEHFVCVQFDEQEGIWKFRPEKVFEPLSTDLLVASIMNGSVVSSLISTELLPKVKGIATHYIFGDLSFVRTNSG